MKNKNDEPKITVNIDHLIGQLHIIILPGSSDNQSDEYHKQSLITDVSQQVESVLSAALSAVRNGVEKSDKDCPCKSQETKHH